MFFGLLGRMVRRAWLPILLAWLLVLLGTYLFAPPFNELAKDSEFGFLPADAPSRRAEEVYRKAFPDDNYSSNIVLVMHRVRADATKQESDLEFIEKVVEPRLWQIAQEDGGLASQPVASEEPLFGNDQPAAKAPARRSIIARIRAPGAPGGRTLLVSPDGQAMLVVLELTTEFLAKQNERTIDTVARMVQSLRDEGKVPQGMEISLTGSAVIGRDHTEAELESVRATELLTVLLVVVLLVLIYRAPLLALIPLATVYLGVQVSLNLLAILGGAGYVTLFQGIQIYIIILSYGAGVDYCLFLTARYREELDSGLPPDKAIAQAVGAVGEAVVASAGTVMVGIAMMMFAQFGKFQQAGFAIPLSLTIVLVATLTFSPALLRLAGHWAFWPGKPGVSPGTTPASGGAWHWLAEAMVRRPGVIWLGTVVVMVPFVVIAFVNYYRVSYDLIGTLPATATSAAGSRVLDAHFSPGVLQPVTVLLIDKNTDFSKKAGRDLTRRVTDQLLARKQELGLADVRSLAAPLGSTPAAKEELEGKKEVREEIDRLILQRYVTDLGGRAKIGTRLDLILTQGPFDQASIDSLDRMKAAIRDALPAEDRAATEIHIVGATAGVRDIADVMQADRWRIELLVLASVFAVLVLLLRSVIVPVYLLLSVLFSYFVTMGAVFVVFWALDPTGFVGIDWKVAIFLFTILIAVGEDYNIFLMTRVHEEERELGSERGIIEALIRTGPIISSCGIIMAGTFASLLVGSLAEMKQLGFALPFGVLLDTFVVRPILLPTFLLLLARIRPGVPAKGKETPIANPQEAANP